MTHWIVQEKFSRDGKCIGGTVYVITDGVKSQFTRKAVIYSLCQDIVLACAKSGDTYSEEYLSGKGSRVYDIIEVEEGKILEMRLKQSVEDIIISGL